MHPFDGLALLAKCLFKLLCEFLIFHLSKSVEHSVIRLQAHISVFQIVHFLKTYH
jgi:hypothetical protein